MKGKISNIKGKIQIEVKDLITNHLESVSDSILQHFILWHYYFRHVNHRISTSTEINKFVKIR